jgi:predicted metal-dependent peptidase
MINETASDKEALERLRRSLFDLMIYVPLAGLTILGDSIKVKEDTDIDTMQTDGHSIFYSPAWVKKKNRKSNTFDLLHEWLHIFNNHPRRRGGRDPDIWNYACDVRVAHDGLKLLRQARGSWRLEMDHVEALSWAETLTAEQIYDTLIQQAKHRKEEQKRPRKEGEEEEEPTHDDRMLPIKYKPDMREQPRSDDEEETFVQKFRTSLAQASVAIETATKKNLQEIYGKTMYERFVQIQQGRIPWHLLLRGSLVDILGRERASWSPPNFRFSPDLILPAFRGDKQRELIIPVDVSGSIDPVLLNRFASNLEAAATRATNVIVVTFDAVIREIVETRSPKTVLQQLKFQSGAHSYTSALDVFAFAATRNPQAIVVYTDGHLRIPKEPVRNTFWVIPEHGPTMDWGRTIHMQQSW